MAGLLDDLIAVVGRAHVLTDGVATAQTDYTGRYQGHARVVVRPADTAQAAGVVAACSAGLVPVVPQGGHTGLVGGGTPRGGEVVVSTVRMSEIGVEGRTIVAGAGATLTAVRAAAEAADLRFPLDIASRDSATIGGMIATNAAGAYAAVAGPMGDQLVGVEGVLADGSVVDELDGGSRLLPHAAGSEGTLAIITRARLRLTAPTGNTATALVGLATSAEGERLAGGVVGIEAAEIIYRRGLEQVCATYAMSDPLPDPHPCYVLLEAAGDDPMSALGVALSSVPDTTVAVAVSPGDRMRLWRYRELHTDAILRLGVPIKLDLRVPPEAVDEFVHEASAAITATAPTAATFVFGHLLDGDLHVNVVGTDPGDRRIEEVVYRLVARLGGSIVGEHGVGTAKADLLWLTEDPGALSEIRATKDRLDPDGILNPGVRMSGAERP